MMLKKNRGCVVVDLDGTLLTANSFEKYLVFVLKEGIKKFRIDQVIGVGWYVFLRKIRLVSHEIMKFHLLKITCGFMTNSRIRLFVRQCLCPLINEKVYSLCEKYKAEGYEICLSTAAPENYVAELFHRINLDYYLATPMPLSPQKQWRENVRVVKCKQTLEYLAKKNLELDVFITDHYDDTPLLEIPKAKNILINPTDDTIKKLEEKNIKFEVLTEF